MIGSDRRINQLEIDIDDLCLSILARRQPVASDLRFITIALKLVTDLERIGDLGVNICERVVELNEEPPLKPYVDLPNMAAEAQDMVREALDAFVAGDRRAGAIGHRPRQERRRLLHADLPRASDLHDGGRRATSTARPAYSRSPSISSVSATTRPTSPRWWSSWSKARTSATWATSRASRRAAEAPSAALRARRGGALDDGGFPAKFPGRHVVVTAIVYGAGP